MATVEQVRAYYNQMTASYLDIYGDVIQAFRPSDTEKLLDYVGRSAGINWNMNVLDLGCGVAGPAIHFAKRWNANVDGVTISEVQLAEGKNKVEQENLQNKVHLFLGDYHHLENSSLQNNYYDIVLFLESLGHSDNVQKAIENAYQKLKRNGVIYIKDFYRKIVDDSEHQKKIDKVILSINENYAYNTLEIEQVKTALTNVGFTIESIKSFDFIDDTKIRSEFEHENNIDIFEGLPEFYPADWLEIRCRK